MSVGLNGASAWGHAAAAATSASQNKDSHALPSRLIQAAIPSRSSSHTTLRGASTGRTKATGTTFTAADEADEKDEDEGVDSGSGKGWSCDGRGN
jgi:hypothetical protein